MYLTPGHPAGFEYFLIMYNSSGIFLVDFHAVFLLSLGSLFHLRQKTNMIKCHLGSIVNRSIFDKCADGLV